MARARKSIKNPIFALIPTPAFQLGSSPASSSSFTSLLFTSRKSPRTHTKLFFTLPPTTLSLFFLSFLVSSSFFALSVIRFIPSSQDSVLCSLITSPASQPSPPSVSTSRMRMLLASLLHKSEDDPGMGESVIMPLPIQGVGGNVSKEEREFWEQPDGEGYKPCLGFSLKYRKESARISKENKRFLMVVASGGLNQQRNQIVDAVVIARILEAALVLPVLQVNPIWGDDSEFADIFYVEHFKRTLRADVRIVSSLPSTHLMERQSVENHLPHDASPLWIRTRFYRLLTEEGVLILRGLDSKLSKNLSPDLQKLRCKVAFHALRFAAPLQELGNRLARRMWIEGPYIGLHLRLEKDVWVRSGCPTGLGPEYDNIITNLQDSHPEYLTGRHNMSHIQRRLSGQCPLNAHEVARLLKALGAPGSARVYIAGGEPFGGAKALQPLLNEFRNVISREMLAKGGELLPYLNKTSSLTAIDYIVSLSSNVFLPSHGGNMARVMQGHRAYVGHRKYIRPNKRGMLPYFENSSLSDAEFGSIIRGLHNKSRGQPAPRTNKRDRGVVAYPVPECMCKNSKPIY